ncbi:MAG TPA: FHA domain-containing protein [Gemmatimonadales bacterium]|nr:FHA domain-containing protein [Gemmatimonadales bacterium]
MPRDSDRMLQLEVAGQRYSIAAGEMVVGSAPDATLPLGGEGIQPRHAIVQGLSDGTVVVRRGDPDAEVLVNGVRQGNEPTPVLHGDKIQVGPYELLVVDPERAGHTKFFDSSAFERFTPATAVKPPATSVATGGRLVCLTDGREYQIGAGPLALGRDAGCDVVVPGNDVSRRHAQIDLAEAGYVIADLSTNGTFVNGARVEGTRLLQRADVIRVGADEFRFYAEAAAPVVPAAAPAGPPDASKPPPGAEHRLHNTMMGVPKVESPPPGPVTPVTPIQAPIASLLVRSGTLKGKRLAVRTPVVNIGRGEYNDLVLPEPSVSASHAKLQRREEIWVIADLGSTNGTFVDGERVTEETALGPGATIRFGEVSTLFESTDDVTGIQPRVGTRMMEGLPPPPPPGPGRREPAAAAPRRPIRTPPPRREGLPSWVVAAVLAALAAFAAYLLLT